jgi:biotin carboxyl carrier protein
VESNVLEQTRQRINRLVEEIARLSESQIAPTEYYAEFLQRVLTAIAAPAGVIWGRTAQGNLQLQYQIGLSEVGLDRIEGAKESHDELLRQAAQQGRPLLVPPHSGPGRSEAGPAPANLTGYVILLAPIIIEKQVAGLIEVWQDANRSPSAQRGFIQFLVSMAEYASLYLRNARLRQMLGQQQLWTQLEAFARQIHGSLNPREVAYLVANEGRRLIDCDRVSVAVRLGSSTRVEAISGADVIEKRSSLVQAMRRLFHAVLTWGEKLIYTGAKDDSLPPRVLQALDEYLAESNSKMLIVMPMKDEREAEKKRPARSALLVEAFEPTFAVDQLLGRMEVVVKHAAPALYNALEHKRIPLRWALMPLANIKDGLRGNRLAIFLAVLASLAILIAALVVVPYPLRMSAEGQFLPKERQVVYSRVTGPITNVKVNPGDYVQKGQELLTIHDRELQQKIDDAQVRMTTAERLLATYREQIPKARTDDERQRLELEAIAQDQAYQKAKAELELLLDQTRNPRAAVIPAPISGTVVTFDLNDRLLGRTVKPGDPLMQVARLDGVWVVELRIPEANVGHIREALARSGGKPLEVDLLLASHPDRTFKGQLSDDGLGGEVTMHNNAPVLLARVEVRVTEHTRAEVEAMSQAERERKGILPGVICREELNRMPVGAEVRAKVRCGKRAVGYVWFYELWEFFYEHVWF